MKERPWITGDHEKTADALLKLLDAINHRGYERCPLCSGPIKLEGKFTYGFLHYRTCPVEEAWNYYDALPKIATRGDRIR